MKYEKIVFMQGDNATEALEIFEKSGEEGALQYLSQWHYPGEHETCDEPSYGLSDDVYEIAGYILAVNTSLGYIGLEYQI